MQAVTFSAANVYSQSGEDGILSGIFEHLGISGGTFCEFGAWDGKHLSNTYALCERGWSGVYIEGDVRRFRDLAANISDLAEGVNAFVHIEGEDTLDRILRRSKTFASTDTIDLLSIDIDSDDLAVWKSLKTYRAKVVVIEFNPTIPVDVFFENPPGLNRGNSARAIHDFARASGYVLVAVTSSNLIFVDENLASGFRELELIDPDLCLGMRYFFGYDGTLMMQKTGRGQAFSAPEIVRVPWANVRFGQPVDRPFRRYAPSPVIRMTARLWSYFKLIFTKPGAMLRRIMHLPASAS